MRKTSTTLRSMMNTLALALSVIVLLACAGEAPATSPTAPAQATMSLSSAAFADGESIPAKYSCDGEDISPPLSWGEPPQGTASFLLIMDDPDAPGGTWTHWVLINIPADARSLPEGAAPEGGAIEGKNSWGSLGYGGPCPPSGTHHYVFTLYALDVLLEPSDTPTRETALEAIEGHVLGTGRLVGTYSRGR